MLLPIASLFVYILRSIQLARLLHVFVCSTLILLHYGQYQCMYFTPNTLKIILALACKSQTVHGLIPSFSLSLLLISYHGTCVYYQKPVITERHSTGSSLYIQVVSLLSVRGRMHAKKRVMAKHNSLIWNHQLKKKTHQSLHQLTKETYRSLHQLKKETVMVASQFRRREETQN